MPILERANLHVRQQGAKRIFNAFQRQYSAGIYPANFLDSPVTGGEKLRRSLRDRPILRLDASREHGVQRGILRERLFRFLLVQTRWIFLAEQSPVQRETEPPGRDAKA